MSAQRRYTCMSRYLAAKRSVDDRALNRPVWDALRAALPDGSLRVLEVGAGIGTGLERALAWDLFGAARRVDYSALDSGRAQITVLRHRLAKRRFAADGDTLRRDTLTVRPLLADMRDFWDDPAQHAAYDVLLAHAVVDLLNLPTAVPQLLRLLRPGGLFYWPITFDGVTSLEPAIDPSFDAEIERLYHQTMDQRRSADGQPSGDSRSGRHLLAQLRAAGVPIIAAGSSDWVVFADAHGRYTGDEAYFLHFIIDTIAQALAGHPALPAARFADWIATRHAQIDAGTLIYIAHQLDVLGRQP